MFVKLRNHFGIPGILAIAALVFAMIGGAYAASDSGGGKATASAKGKKGATGPRGPRGRKGAPGAAGPAGPQGPAGAKGDAGGQGAAGEKGPSGATGPTGPTGLNGTNGKSVVVTAADEVTECVDLGGVVVEKEGEPVSAIEICNGEKGEIGEKGSPWVPDNTLPAGATLTGAWSFNGTDADTEFLVPLSFPIKLASPLFGEEGKLHFTSGATTECPGNAGDPAAAPGNLCVYFATFGGEPVNATFGGIFKPGEPINEFTEEVARPAGAIVQFLFDGEAGELASGSGTWAVTGF